MLKLLIVALALVGLNQIDAFGFGTCVKSPVIADFNIAKYVGKWYEIQHIAAPFEPNLRCVTATYIQQNSTQIEVDNKGISVETGKETGIQGFAYVTDSSAPNHLILKFPNIPAGSYNVWETNYDGYTLIYSCTQIVPYILKNELIYILSRKNTLEQTTVDRLRDLMTTKGVSAVNNLLITDQNC